MSLPPILANKSPDQPSIFEPSALLRESRRQKRLPEGMVPPICILDPDGDIVRRLKSDGKTVRSTLWPCYHTELFEFRLGSEITGIIGCAVGASFAVLVAEELFACGCRMLISLTSAGQIVPVGKPPYFVVIDRALRDEGTSYHYALADTFAEADARIVATAAQALAKAQLKAHIGASWTTDAPFRETAAAVEAARKIEVMTVEMEAAALYTFARAKGKDVLCLAHVTNTMGRSNEDFEKGEADGTTDALNVLEALARAFRPSLR